MTSGPSTVTTAANRPESRPGGLRRARAIVGTAGVAVALPIMLLFGLVLMPLGDWLGGRRRLGYEIGRAICGACWRIAGIRVEQEARHRIEPVATRIYMPNHQSLVDMPAVLYVLPGANGTLIKAEAFRWPLVGRAFRAAGFTAVERGSARAAVRSLNELTDRIREGNSLVIAPEGTRSRTGRLGRFRTGGFRIAARAGVPVAPITVRGAREILPPGGRLIYPGRLRIRFHDPVETAGISERDRPAIGALAQRVRDAVASDLDDA